MNGLTGKSAALLIALALPGLAAATERTDAELAITEAGTAVESAERADATQYAAADITEAHAMLANAQAAYDHRHWVESAMDSESAKADANLAAARSRQHIAEAMTAELDRTVGSLRQQLNITGGQP
jgi:hypothetical protein